MNKYIHFKKIHNRIGIYIKNNLLKEISAKEFLDLISTAEKFKDSNPVLFEEKYNYITIDMINDIKYGIKKSLNKDFSKNLKYVNIRPIYFYKKDETFLFYDFVYKSQSKNISKPNEYGITNYNINNKEAISISIKNIDELNIKRGYITNSYLRGLFEDELKDLLINIDNLNIYINGNKINKDDFWNNSVVIEYDTLFSSEI